MLMWPVLWPVPLASRYHAPAGGNVNLDTMESGFPFSPSNYLVAHPQKLTS